MKHLIEFKLHNREIPYFVDDCLHGFIVDNHFYGVSCDDTGQDYLPSTVVKLEPQAFLDLVKPAKLYKYELKDNPFPDESEKGRRFPFGTPEARAYGAGLHFIRLAAVCPHCSPHPK